MTLLFDETVKTHRQPFLQLAIVAAFMAVAAPAAAQDPPEPASAGVYAAIDAFHAFLESGDSTAALAMLDPEVTIYESGRAETLAEYRGAHLLEDIAFAQAVESTVIEEWAGFDARQAIVGRVYGAKGTFQGREIDAVTTETVFLLRTPGGSWRIRHLHWSSRPASPTE
jgi:opacity protein-like surface antigen